MAGPVKRTTPCISLKQLSKWIGQLLNCVTPNDPKTWGDVVASIPYSTELEDVHVVYEPINLRATLWSLKKKHPLVDLALETMGSDDNCTLLVKDATIPGKNGLFILYCRLYSLVNRTQVFSGDAEEKGIYGYCQLGENEGIYFHASQCTGE